MSAVTRPRWKEPVRVLVCPQACKVCRKYFVDSLISPAFLMSSTSQKLQWLPPVSLPHLNSGHRQGCPSGHLAMILVRVMDILSSLTVDPSNETIVTAIEQLFVPRILTLGNSNTGERRRMLESPLYSHLSQCGTDGTCGLRTPGSAVPLPTSRFSKVL